MKRVFRRSILKHQTIFSKITVIIFLCFVIFYLKSENSIEEEKKPSNSKIVAQNIQKNVKPNRKNSDEFVAAVLVMCANRANALKNHLTQLLAQRPSSSQYHIVISQDGYKPDVREVAVRFVNEFKNVSFIQHNKIAPARRGNNYPAISAHYKWALDKIFIEKNYEHVIITEDDLDVGNDFFSYFEWGKKVLEQDQSVWCISAWNDNGATQLIDPSRGDVVWRTDFFPGLGWMLKRSLWLELSSVFPNSYWDDWMRKSEIRKNRVCIRPEISRTSHNMKLAGKGSSGGMFKDFLSRIGASTSNIDFSLIPPFIVQKNIYDAHLIEDIKNSKLIDIKNDTVDLNVDNNYSYKVAFNNIREWNKLAKFFKIMTDIRGGMQRTAYYGVVTVVFKNSRFYLIPLKTMENPDQLTKYEYNPDWDKQNRFIEFENYYCKTKKYTGKCDPHSPEMIEFFKKKGWKKRLIDWGEMIVV